MVENDEGKELTVIFFASAQGNEAVREWLKEELTEDQRRAVGKDIAAVEFGWPIGMPTVRKLYNELWEVRTIFKDGIARVLFTIDGDKMVLLHGFKKKSNKAPLNEIETAGKRLALYKEMFQ